MIAHCHVTLNLESFEKLTIKIIKIKLHTLAKYDFGMILTRKSELRFLDKVCEGIKISKRIKAVPLFEFEEDCLVIPSQVEGDQTSGQTFFIRF